jgi:hypothetical protein
VTLVKELTGGFGNTQLSVGNKGVENGNRDGGIVVCIGAAETVATTMVGEVIGTYKCEEGSWQQA